MGNVPPPAHQASTGEFFAPLDGLRGIAILSVVFYHTLYFNPAQPFQKALLLLAQGGGMGVPIFFVLSGFLIAYTVMKAGGDFDVPAYAARRAAKILPPFYLALLVFGLMATVWKGPAGQWESTLAFATTHAHFRPANIGVNDV
jgi:peptidoglycan/LPS O-acetylase OafA/YrhL